MPVVQISLWSGRSQEQKNELAKAITDDFVKILNVTAESVQVIFQEIDKNNWSVGGQFNSK